MFEEAYLRREMCVSEPYSLEGNLPFLVYFTLHLREISKYKPPGGLMFVGAI